MKEFYKSIYNDVMSHKPRAALYAVCTTLLYAALTLGVSHPSLAVEVASHVTAVLAVAGLGLIVATDSQHGMRNQKSVVYVTYTLFILLVVTGIQAMISVVQGHGLFESGTVYDASGAVVSAYLNVEEVILVLLFTLIWVGSLAISNKIERKQKVIKGIHSKNIFK